MLIPILSAVAIVSVLILVAVVGTFAHAFIAIPKILAKSVKRRPTQSPDVSR